MVTELTPALLLNTLESISTARTDAECTEALITGATMLQQAVLNNQPVDSVYAAFNEVPREFASHLEEVIGRAVDFHALEGDATLSLWLVPVSVDTSVQFTAPVSLVSGMSSIRAGGVLLEQLGMTKQQLGSKTGWILPIPALYTEDQLNAVDLNQLIPLPLAARSIVQGKAQAPVLKLEQDDVAPGGHVLFMPFVSYAPVVQQGVLELSSKVASTITAWVKASLVSNGMSDDTQVGVPDVPRPFSETMREAPSLAFRARAQHLIDASVIQTGTAPAGLVASVSTYVTQQAPAEPIVGICFVSRLTQRVVGQVSLRTVSETGAAEMADAVGLLRGMNFSRVAVSHATVGSFFCQHCGNLQISIPADVLVDHAQVESPPHYH